MANEKIIAQDVFEQSIKDILQLIANNTYNWQEYTDTEISDILEISDEQAIELSKIINDNVKSNIKLWSSNKVDTEIQNAIIEANKYADELIGQISSISLEYVTSLPTTDIKSNVIYILQGTPNTLNVYNTSTSAFVTVGDLDLDLSQYYTKTEIDTLLADKADKDSVVTSDDIITDTTQATGANVLAASTTITELDKKFDKTSILTSNSNTATDEQVYSAALLNTLFSDTRINMGFWNGDLNDIPFIKIHYTYIYRVLATSGNIPGTVGGTVYHAVYTDTNTRRVQIFVDINAVIFTRAYIDTAWTGWKRVCATSVANTEGTATITNSASGRVSYKVKNGVCYASVTELANELIGSEVCEVTGLPKTDIYVCIPLMSGTTVVGLLWASPNSTTFYCNKSDANYGYCSFSYPVAES